MLTSGHAESFLLFENPYGNKDVYLGVDQPCGANDSTEVWYPVLYHVAPKDGATEFTLQ